MTGEQQPRSIGQRIFGRRSNLLLGWLWTAVGVLWLVDAIISPSTFRYFLAGIWLVLGVSQLTYTYWQRAAARRQRGSSDSATQ